MDDHRPLPAARSPWRRGSERADAFDAWFNELYALFLLKWHPAIAAIEAHCEAKKRSKPALP